MMCSDDQLWPEVVWRLSGAECEKRTYPNRGNYARVGR